MKCKCCGREVVRINTNHLKFCNNKIQTEKEYREYYGVDTIDPELRKKYNTASKDSWIKRHGEVEGLKKYNEYVKRQAETCKFEHFEKSRGWSKKEFDVFNKSRSVTEENLINRHGKVEGKSKFDRYRERQGFTNTKEYFVEKYGKDAGTEKYKNVNFLKSHSLETYQHRFGEVEGLKAFDKWVENSISGYSKISQDLFWNIYNENDYGMDESNTFFAELNREFGRRYEGRGYKFDFVANHIKLCIEFNGDLYHANPTKYSPNDIPKFPNGNSLTAKELWDKDNFKNNILISEGYKVIVVWENDYKKQKKYTLEKVRNEIKERKKLFG